MLLRIAVVVAAVAAMSCHVGGFYAPKPLAGNTPVLISNATHYPICSWHMTLADGSVPDSEWVQGVFKPDAAKRYKVSVKPGVYRLHIEGCNGAFVVKTGDIPINGPTNLLFQSGRPSPFNDSAAIGEVPSYQTILLQVRLSDKQLANEQQFLDDRNSAAAQPAGPAEACRADGAHCGPDEPPCCEGLVCHWKEGGPNHGFSDYCEPQ